MPPAQYGPPRFDALAYYLLHRHVAGDAARGRRGRDADAAGHHQTRRPSRRRSRSSPPTSAIPGATTCSATGSSRRGTRCADWGWRNERRRSRLRSSSLAAGGAARRPDAPGARDDVRRRAGRVVPAVRDGRRRARSRRRTPSTPRSVSRSSRSGAAASRSRFATASTSSCPRRASRRRASGRSASTARTSASAFRSRRRMTPIELTAGYRFEALAPRSFRTSAPASARTGYKETSDFADAGENVDTRHAGFLVVGGVELRVHRWVGIGVDVAVHARARHSRQGRHFEGRRRERPGRRRRAGQGDHRTVNWAAAASSGASARSSGAPPSPATSAISASRPPS